jgi:Spy/CpxP family protein refolding chaperone
MKQITNKFRCGLMAGAIALALPLIANSASWDCKDDHAGLRQPGARAMQNEMIMHIRQGMPPPPLIGMMQPPPFPFEEKPSPPFLLGLDLTESQQDKIFELLHSQEPTMRAQQKAVRRVMAEMNRLETSDHYSPSEVRLLAEKLAKAIADSLVLRAATEAKIRAFLTSEQRKQADEIRARLEADLGHEVHPPQ